MPAKTVLFPALKLPAPEALERYLEQLAADGLHPAGEKALSDFALRLERGEPGAWRYVADVPQRADGGYFRHYAGFGWQFVGRAGGLWLWRAPIDGERPDSFAAPADLERRNNGIYRALTAGFTLCSVVMLLITLFIWRVPSGAPIWTAPSALAADACVLSVMSVLKGIQRRMELGDRERREKNDKFGRFI